MQQRQLRLGDILDDYCTRERRLTNHVIVAMVGDDVKQTRCTTCDCDHEFKHAKVPRQRRKTETPAALYSQVLASGPKRVVHETPPNGGDPVVEPDLEAPDASAMQLAAAAVPDDAQTASADLVVHASASVAPIEADDPDDVIDPDSLGDDDGPVHRPLIRASLPRPEGQPPQTRPMPEFTIRQPGGRPSRFRPRAGGQPFNNTRSNGNGPGGPPRGARSGGGGRPPQGALSSRPGGRRHNQGSGRKRSK